MNRSLAALLPLRRRLLAASAASLSTAASTKRTNKRTPTSPRDTSRRNDEDQGLEVPKDKKLPARPSEIPYQSKIVNCVHLVGRVGVPLELQRLPNGGYAAVSVLVQENPNVFPNLSIPVIFQGDMAQIVAFYLKETDIIYVTGRLIGDFPPSEDENSQGTIKVLVNGLNFVKQKEDMVNDGHAINKNNDLTSNSSEEVRESSEVLNLWEDLLANPHKWWDNRSNKSHKNSAAFRHKDTGQLLWINESTPEWISLKLDTLSFNHKPQNNIGHNSYVKTPENDWKNNIWTDLIANSQDWWDYRLDKQNKNKPKLPDFKHKVNGKALWLDSAPDWVIAKLDGLVFSSGTLTGKVSNDKENLWRSVVDNPNEWWDNRTDKLKPNQPDFKHKVTGEGLWLGYSTPEWVLSKLPPPNSKQKVGATKRQIQFNVPT